MRIPLKRPVHEHYFPDDRLRRTEDGAAVRGCVAPKAAQAYAGSGLLNHAHGG